LLPSGGEVCRSRGGCGLQATPRRQTEGVTDISDNYGFDAKIIKIIKITAKPQWPMTMLGPRPELWGHS